MSHMLVLAGRDEQAVVRQDRKNAKQKRQTRANENAAAAHPCSFQFQAVGRRISCHARQQLGVGPVFHHARVGSGINSPGVSFRHPVRRVAMLHKMKMDHDKFPSLSLPVVAELAPLAKPPRCLSMLSYTCKPITA